MSPTITGIELIEFTYPVPDLGPSGNGFDIGYHPGSSIDRSVLAVRIQTDAGVSGEYVSGHGPAGPVMTQIEAVAEYLIGENPLDRERHWTELKRALRKHDRMGIGPVDIALWDLAGKQYGAPIHELLGTYRRSIPAYASTYHADDHGGLDSPDAYAEFAETCLELGYPAFKLHGWTGDALDIDREVEMVHAVGDRVGDEMELMLDPACAYRTFADALRVGRACDEEGFLWYEDPYRDGGLSQHGHRRLGDYIDTPLLLTEHLRGLEPHTDFAVNEATDFLRADPDYDGGITGTMKIASVAEGLGLDVEIHAPGPAQRHCLAAIRNANYYEMALVHPDCGNARHMPVYDTYSDEIDAIDDSGHVPVPSGPGLGIDYDWSYIDAHQERTVTIA
jgi:L-alanine-DL-glutamate epimerase-like enolase superfamily enzyme